MKKMFNILTATIIFSSSLTVVACISSDVRNNKIILSTFQSELSLIKVIDKDSSIKKIDESIFQKAIFRALETNYYRATNESKDLIFKYYNNDREILWQNLVFNPGEIEKTDSFAFRIIANDKSKYFASQTKIIQTTLYHWKDLIDLTNVNLIYDVNKLKLIPDSEILNYFNLNNPEIFFNSYHVSVIKTENEIIIIEALETSDRYKNKLIINL